MESSAFIVVPGVGSLAMAGGIAPEPWKAQLKGVPMSAPRPSPPIDAGGGPAGTVGRGM